MLGENVHNFLIFGYVLELTYSLMHHVLDEEIFDLNVIQPDQIALQVAFKATLLHVLWQ